MLFNRKLFHIQRNSSLFLPRIPTRFFLEKLTPTASLFQKFLLLHSPFSATTVLSFTEGGKLLSATCKLVFLFFLSPSLFFSMVQRVNEAESPTLNGWMLARCKTLAFSSPFCSLFSLCLYHSIQPFATLFPSLFDHCTLLMLFQTCLCVSNWPLKTIDGISIFPTFIF